MLRTKRNLVALDDRGPLRVMFLTTSMPVGGAETLLVNLVRRLDRERFTPLVACMKSLGPLGEMLSAEMPTFHDLIRHKYDVGVVSRFAKLLSAERVDALVTVGAGDKMFWGRLAARRAGVPVMLCALHSTGWPDAIGRLNGSRPMTQMTDGFIGVADAHGRHLIQREGFPAGKVNVIPNGVDVERFSPNVDGMTVRHELKIDRTTPVAGIVAALRKEKDHELFLRSAAEVRKQVPAAQFLIVGDGPERARLEKLTGQLQLTDCVRFLGTRADIPQIVAALDVLVLTSKIEANPVSILEAMACGKPVVAPNVGSIGESVRDGQNGYLTQQGNQEQVVDRLVTLLGDPTLAQRMGQAGREAVVERWSLERMVSGYERLIADIYSSKCGTRRERPPLDYSIATDFVYRAPTLP